MLSYRSASILFVCCLKLAPKRDFSCCCSCCAVAQICAVLGWKGLMLGCVLRYFTDFRKNCAQNQKSRNVSRTWEMENFPRCTVFDGWVSSTPTLFQFWRPQTMNDDSLLSVIAKPTMWSMKFMLWSLMSRDCYIRLACRSICDQDQKSWWVKIILDHLIAPFRGFWLLDFMGVESTKTLRCPLSIWEIDWY